MAVNHDDELREAEEESAAIAEAQLGYDPGSLAEQLANSQTAAMGKRLADRYASIGVDLLSDQAPSRLDSDLIERLSRIGFDPKILRAVRVHRGLKAQSAADALGARAFALGDQDVFFGRGEFDPASRSGRAVIAHEVAHIAPPSGPLGLPDSFSSGMGAPVLNERKTGSEDAAGEEEHEESARAAEAMIYAQDDDISIGGPDMVESPDLMQATTSTESESAPIEAHVLEAKVLALLDKMARSEAERRGQL